MKLLDHFYWGDVPKDLFEYSLSLKPSHLNALGWQLKVKKEIEGLGYLVLMEQPAYTELHERGRIDLVAFKNGKSVGIELDNRIGRRSQYEKLRAFQEEWFCLEAQK